MSNKVLTVSQFCQQNTAFTEGGLRWLIFNANKNGLNDSGAILRIGRRVLIDEEIFFIWMRQQSGSSTSPANINTG